MLKKNLLLVCALLFFPSQAFAYIDPGSGSAITAAIIAFFSGLFFYFKKYYYKIKNFIKKIFRSQ
jgi:hypothetical protein